jgi:hypothetical protein
MDAGKPEVWRRGEPATR